MRIKINDKIYRLKEIESGVDSLMELVEEPKYKDGDFVVNTGGCVLIFKKKVGDRICAHAVSYSALGAILIETLSDSPIMRYATEEEKQTLLDALEKERKRWNAEKLCVEDIPEKPKKGDLAIFWDNVSRRYASVRIFSHLTLHRYFDISGVGWDNAIKFESKEQYERFIKGEI
jgi:hypothetical protein